MKKPLQIFNTHNEGKICKHCNCGRKEEIEIKPENDDLMAKYKKILILGSEGLIGKTLCRKLKEYKIYQLDKKINVDIINPKDYSVLEERILESDFVFFLAFDVGGSQYLEKFEHTKNFISNNVLIMENVFSLLEKHKKPFVFASSMMSKIPHSTYGLLKSIGERYTKSLEGISVRFWNVYGIEEIEPGKNHVITDFIISALKDKKIECKTDGNEVRQFIYADDACDALKKIMNEYKQSKKMSKTNNNCIDISNRKWTSIRDVANKIASQTNSVTSFAEQSDRVQCDAKIEPNLDIITNLGWKPNVSLDDGIKIMIENIKK